MSLLAYILVILTAGYCLMVLIFLLGLFKPQTGQNTQKLSASVIIAARNEEACISNILDDLLNQDYPRHLFDITIVDDGSADRTADIVDTFAKTQNNIRCLRLAQIPAQYSPKKYALEYAVKHAKGEIILTTDADCRISPQWIRTMLRYFTKGTGFVIGFSQLSRPNQPHNFIEKLQSFDFLELMGAAAGTTNLGYPLAASGQNMGYRKSAFLQINGYSRVSHRVSGDDVLLVNLIRKYTHYNIVFASNPLAYVFSQPQPTLISLLNQRIRWASNGSYQILLNQLFFAYLLLTYMFNLLLLAWVPLVLFYPLGWGPFLGALAVRFLCEGFLAIKSTLYFNRKDLLLYFPIWFFAQMPYIIIVGLLGTFGRFNWKQRVYSAEVSS